MKIDVDEAGWKGCEAVVNDMGIVGVRQFLIYFEILYTAEGLCTTTVYKGLIRDWRK